MCPHHPSPPRCRHRGALTATAVLAALLLMALLAAPVAADHAYSHKWVVTGRVIDSAGEPVRGVAVEVELIGVPDSANIEGVCSTPTFGTPPAGERLSHAGHQRTATDARGFYVACFHVHSIKQPVKVAITIEGATQELQGDLNHRLTIHKFRAQTEMPAKDPGAVATFPTSFDVRGKLWTPGEATVEGVEVLGTTPIGEKLTVRLRGTGVNLSLTGTTDDYGDYALTFYDAALESLPSDLVVIVTGGRVKTMTEAPADRTFRFNYHNVEATNVRDGPGLTIPGAELLGDDPWVLLLVVLGIIAATAVSLVVGRRYAVASARRQRALDLRNLAGIGAGTLRRLEAAGIHDLEELAAADAGTLAKGTGLKSKTVQRWVDQAQQRLAKGPK